LASAEVFDAAQRTLRGRSHQTWQLRSPNYLAGLVKCELCGAAMHVTYSGTETKSRFKYQSLIKIYLAEMLDRDSANRNRTVSGVRKPASQDKTKE
jgi:hypothetical protein